MADDQISNPQERLSHSFRPRRSPRAITTAPALIGANGLGPGGNSLKDIQTAVTNI